MTTIKNVKTSKGYNYCEFSPSRKEAIDYFASISVATIIVATICSLTSYYNGVSTLDLWVDTLNFAVVSILAYLFSFIFLMPVSVVIEGETISLREGRLPFGRRREFSLGDIREIQMVPFQPEIHGTKRRKRRSANHWILGGDKVLEIVLQDADRVIFVSPRTDQLASFLHEMTRIPVEDCR